MDVHLAWRAESVSFCGGRVVVGTAPTGQIRAAADCIGAGMLRCRRNLFRVVASHGRLMPADGLVAEGATCLGVLDLDETPGAGLRPAMVTANLVGELAERYMKALSGYPSDIDSEATFVAVLDGGPGADSLLARLGEAGTVRHTELGRIVLAIAGAMQNA